VNLEPIRGLAQPDQRSCGPSSLVAAHMLLDPTYAPTSFSAEVLDLHRRVTAPTLGGRAQLPWPRALGTPPWAVARAMSEFAGMRYTSTLVPFHDRRTLFGRLRAAVTASQPAPFFVGDWIPRHVVLAVEPTDTGVLVYNPALGTIVEMPEPEFAAARLSTFGRWIRPWFVVLPDSYRREGRVW